MKTKQTASTLAAFFALSAAAILPASAANLVLNGDFSNGFNDFTSDYTQVVLPQNQQPANTGMFANATYTVFKDPSYTHLSWQQIPAGNPYNSTNQNMLILNGGASGTDIVWRTTAAITVPINTALNFQAIVTNVFEPDLPAFNGAILTYQYSYNNSAWNSLATIDLAQNVSGTWNVSEPPTFNTGSNTNVWLRITNAQTAVTGNDFAIGLISLSTAPIPEPGTVALFGVAGAVCLLGRRRNSRQA